MNGHRSLDPARTRSVRARLSRLVDRYETSVVFLVVAWTVAFLVRSRLAQAERLTEVANEALLSLLFVVPIMLIAWGALVVADRRFKLGLLGSGDRP
jgi:heme/copper-type cytochrome/quinol oxidase subunit 2